MAGKIWKYDCYDLRKFDPYEINYFFDIGTNTGIVALQAKVLYPKVKVIGIEPAKDTFEMLKNNIKQWKSTEIELCDVELYNIALGDGGLMNMHRKGKAGCGMNKFYSEKEKHKWTENQEYIIKSKTIKDFYCNRKKILIIMLKIQYK